MNIERIEALASHIEKLPTRAFSMAIYESCGTPQCIAGHTIALWGSPDADLGDSVEAARLLGLNFHKSRALFLPVINGEWGGSIWAAITPQHAVRVLRNLAATGKVDWSLA